MDTRFLSGRAASLAVLSDAITAAAEHGDALLISGEAGIGKTECVQAVGAMARSAGYLVLDTAGHEGETNLAFAGLHRLLRPVLGSTGGLPDVQRLALLSAFGIHDGARGDRFVVSVATVNLLAQMSTTSPLLITADDVQWLDEETRHVIAFVARRLKPHVVIVVASASADALPGPRDSFRELRLARLDDAAARALLAQRAPDLEPAQRDWVVSQAVGNPLALTELAKSPVFAPTTKLGPIDSFFPLSPSLERAFAGRVKELPKPSRDAALVAAVASDASLPEILAATARMSGQGMTPTVLEPLQELGLLRFDEKRVYFSHPLVRAAIAQKEPMSRRQSAHRALGAVITRNFHRRAWHRALGTASYDDAIADELEATTTNSIRHGDTAAAIAALERAAQLSGLPVNRGRRLIVAAQHAARLGQSDVVVRLLQSADNGELSKLDNFRARLLHEELDGIVVDHSTSVIQLCGASAIAATAGETDLALDLVVAAGRRRCEARVNARARTELSKAAGSLARVSGDARGVTVLALADPIAHGRAVLSMLADIEEDTVIDGDAATAYALAAHAVGHDLLAAKLFDRAELELRAGGRLGQLARNLTVAADLHLDLGEWERAAAELADLATLSEASRSPDQGVAVLVTTAKSAALRGEAAAGLELVAMAEHSTVASRGSSFLARAQVVRGLAYIASGRYHDAYTALRRVFEPSDPSHHFHAQFGAVAYFAEAAVHTGRHDDATAVIERMQSICTVSGSPALAGQLMYATAVLAPDDVAEPLFLDALASDSSRSPWPRARLQLAYGRWLRRQQRIMHSRGPLQAALTTLQQLGATRWSEEALDEFEATGANRDERVLPADSVLSPQESKIARLAAGGLSNKEIGQQLYISPRTVSSHLYRIFPKLGISTRSQLSSRLGEVAT